MIGFRASMVAKVDGNTLRTQRTRARVLAEGLRLFNELGEPHVTTGAIAAELGISPGNLYYHFRSKDQIVEELFARFEERIGVQPGEPRGGPEAIEDLWLYLHLMLEAIWDYRFLYRNLDDLLADPHRRLDLNLARGPRRRGALAGTADDLAATLHDLRRTLSRGRVT